MVMLLLSIALQIATLHCPLVPPDCITQAGDDVLAAAHMTCAAPPYVARRLSRSTDCTIAGWFFG